MCNVRNKIYKLRQRHKAAAVFGDWEETLIWSCLQDVMGDIYVDDPEMPASAMAVLGDFCFLAGVPDEDLAAYKPAGSAQTFMIMVPQNEGWCRLIESHYKEKAKKVVRFAFKKEKDIFDREVLETAVVGLAEKYRIRMIDESLFMQCKNLPWARDLVSQYENYSEYQDHGMGVVILKDGEIVSGASSYAGYKDGIEIEIDTKEGFRRQGLACIAGAKLILAAIERGWYPSWDAQNEWSARLAKKLGYHFDKAYTAYEICGY